MNRAIRWMFLALIFSVAASGSSAQSGSELRMAMRSEPRTFNPMLVADDSSEVIRYLTGGVLIRVNRVTQDLHAELAESWKLSEGGKRIRFKLRRGLKYSDGTPFDSQDVAATIRTLMDPNLHSPTGDAFRTGEGEIRAEVHGPYDVSIVFPTVVAGVERLFDQVVIVSSRSPNKESAVLGPYTVEEHKAGSHILLRRNPNYWKKDSSGRALPYIEAVRFDIQQNRDLELLRFRRGELHLINSLDPENFARLQNEMPEAAKDLGASFDTEQAWFNEVARSPIPQFRKEWFASRNFRRAISEAINRDDMCRLVFGGHARPGIGPISPANQFWFNRKLSPHPYDPQGALRRLREEGFALKDGKLFDKAGNAVEFSVITNAGNKSRERMATMMQQDLAKIGIQLNVVPLDFPSLIERITRTFDYEMCLLGLVNVDLDPMGQMNVWLSSSAMHQWNPEQKTPATPWEAELDRWVRAQASTSDAKARKKAFDRVQEIVWEEAPFLYLVHKNALVAVSPALRNVTPAVLRPQTYWNVEYLYFGSAESGKKQ